MPIIRAQVYLSYELCRSRQVCQTLANVSRVASRIASTSSSYRLKFIPFSDSTWWVFLVCKVYKCDIHARAQEKKTINSPLVCLALEPSAAKTTNKYKKLKTSSARIRTFFICVLCLFWSAHDVGFGSSFFFLVPLPCQCFFLHVGSRLKPLSKYP